MENATQIDYRALLHVKVCYQENRITKQQYKTLRGQVLSGDGDAAIKGLRKILERGREEK